MIDYEDRLELAWEADDGADEREAARREAANLAVLTGVTAVEEGSSVRLREEQPELYHELERINARLDLLMDLVGRLLSERRAQGRTRRVKVAVEQVTFAAEADEAQPGQAGRLQLFLHSSVPEPLILVGRIVADSRDDEGRRWARFQPYPMGGRLLDALGQLVFRHHRRMVAEQRSRRDHDTQS